MLFQTEARTQMKLQLSDVTKIAWILTEFDGHEAEAQARTFALYPHLLDVDRWIAVIIQNDNPSMMLSVCK